MPQCDRQRERKNGKKESEKGNGHINNREARSVYSKCNAMRMEYKNGKVAASGQKRDNICMLLRSCTPIRFTFNIFFFICIFSLCLSLSLSCAHSFNPTLVRSVTLVHSLTLLVDRFACTVFRCDALDVFFSSSSSCIS